MLTTKVGRFDIPVRNSHTPSLVWFDAGVHGKQFGERGVFAFWAAVMKKPKGKKIWGRSLVTISSGDRFDRMKKEQYTARTKEVRKVYSEFWNKRLKKGKNISYIRPCTIAEIKKWTRTHQEDAQFIKFFIVNGEFKVCKLRFIKGS